MKSVGRSFISVLLLAGIVSIEICLAQPKIVWSKSYGNASREVALDIQLTADHGFILTGDTGVFHVTNRDYWLVNLLDDGNLNWSKTLGGTGDDFHSHTVRQTGDMGYIVIGNTNSPDGELGVYKLDNSGNPGPTGWNHNYGDATMDYGNNDIKQTSTGYILCGNVNSNTGMVKGFHGDEDAWIATLGVNGAVEWNTTMGGTGYDIPQSILQDNKGGYVMAGTTGSTDGDITGKTGTDLDMWAIRWNSDKTVNWKTTFGGSGYDFANCVVQPTPDGGYIVFGSSSSNNFFSGGSGNILTPGGHHARSADEDDGDFLLAKLTSEGVLEWARNYGGSGEETGSKVITTCDGGYLLIGTTGSSDGDVTVNNGSDDYWLVKTDANGMIIWEKSLGGSGSDLGNSICQLSDGSIIVAGGSNSNDGDIQHDNHGDYDYWVVKLTEASLGDIVDVTVDCHFSWLRGKSYDFSAPVFGNTCKLTPTYTWTVSGCASIKPGTTNDQEKFSILAKSSGSPPIGPCDATVSLEVRLGTLKWNELTVIHITPLATPFEQFMEFLTCRTRIFHRPPRTRRSPVDIVGPSPELDFSLDRLSERDLRELESVANALAKEAKEARGGRKPAKKK